MITNIKQAAEAGKGHALGLIAMAEGPIDPADVPEPLSGEWAGMSIPEIFGSWDNATEPRMEAYEMAYYKEFIRAELRASK